MQTHPRAATLRILVMTTDAAARPGARSSARPPPPLRGLRALLGARSAVDVLNALQPARGVAVAHDLAYAADARHRLDLYRPRRAARPAPVVVFFYGGGWNTGAKSDYAFVGAALARRGHVVLIPDYRLYPQVRWPDFLRDGAAAIRWARHEAGRHGGDPHRIVLMGHSAGAYNAVTLALDGRWLAEVGLEPRRHVRAAVGLSGPYDFLPLHTDQLRDIFGPEARRPQTQPINHVSADAPPLWLGTGAHDTIVLPRNSISLARRARQAGGRVELAVYPRPNHSLMVGALATPLRVVAPVLRDVTAFIGAHAGSARP